MDKQKIKDIISIFEESNIAKMELDYDDIKIKLEKYSNSNTVSVPVEVKAQPQVIKEEKVSEVTNDCIYIDAPLVGTYYSARSPKAKPFVSVGDHVKKGDVICIIEAMKVMNEIQATADGVVSEILVKDEEMVEYAQHLIALR